MENQQITLNATIQLLELIGEGATGHVYRARRADSNNLVSQTVAIKIFKSNRFIPFFKNEVENLLQLRSLYCVSLLSWELCGDEPAILMEWVDGVSLRDVFHSLTGDEFDEIKRQVLLGLYDLEKQGLCHGDLSPSNILIDIHGQVRLIDFGLSRFLKTAPHQSEVYGTLAYLSPERWRGESPTIYDDLYSLGQMLEDLQNHFVGFSLSGEFWKSRAFTQRPREGLLSLEREKRRVEPGPANSHALKRLSKKVLYQKATVKKSVVEDETKQATGERNSIGKWAVRLGQISSLLFFLSFSTSESALQGSGGATLEVRGHRWIQLSLDQKPMGYSPVVMPRLRPGFHRLQWSTATDHGQIELDLKNGQTLVLTEENFF